jgi:hypothetical protein
VLFPISILDPLKDCIKQYGPIKTEFPKLILPPLGEIMDPFSKIQKSPVLKVPFESLSSKIIVVLSKNRFRKPKWIIPFFPRNIILLYMIGTDFQLIFL